MSSQPAPVRRRRAASISLLTIAAVGLAAFLPGVSASAAQPTIGLGAAGDFAVLAGAGITNPGPTTISGDVGTFPTTSETWNGGLTLAPGVDHGGDAVTQQAKTDLTAGYIQAAGATPATSVVTELGGRTLTPGVYTSPTLGITGALTLDAGNDPNAIFVFQAGSTLITASTSSVVGLHGLNPCNVFWQVGSSATLGTGSHLVGSVLAQTSITATTGATIEGRLLARTGAVTLDTNTITNTGCAFSAPVIVAPVFVPAPTPTTTAAPTTTSTTAAPTTTTTAPTTTTSTPTTATTAPTPTATAPSSTGDSSDSANSTDSTEGRAGTPVVAVTQTRTGVVTPTLPRTGSDSRLGLLGAGSLLLGGAALALSGRLGRRADS
jgi:cell division septation protein DedD